MEFKVIHPSDHTERCDTTVAVSWQGPIMKYGLNAGRLSNSSHSVVWMTATRALQDCWEVQDWINASQRIGKTGNQQRQRCQRLGNVKAYFKISKELSPGNKRRIMSESHLTVPRPNKKHLDLSGETLMLQRMVYSRTNLFSVVLLARG